MSQRCSNKWLLFLGLITAILVSCQSANRQPNSAGADPNPNTSTNPNSNTGTNQNSSSIFNSVCTISVDVNSVASELSLSWKELNEKCENLENSFKLLHEELRKLHEVQTTPEKDTEEVPLEDVEIIIKEFKKSLQDFSNNADDKIELAAKTIIDSNLDEMLLIIEDLKPNESTNPESKKTFVKGKLEGLQDKLEVEIDNPKYKGDFGKNTQEKIEEYFDDQIYQIKAALLLNNLQLENDNLRPIEPPRPQNPIAEILRIIFLFFIIIIFLTIVIYIILFLIKEVIKSQINFIEAHQSFDDDYQVPKRYVWLQELAKFFKMSSPELQKQQKSLSKQRPRLPGGSKPKISKVSQDIASEGYTTSSNSPSRDYSPDPNSVLGYQGEWSNKGDQTENDSLSKPTAHLPSQQPPHSEDDYIERLVARYNSNANQLKQQAIVIGATKESLDRRRLGHQTPLIFEENQTGIYWIIQIKNRNCLVPKANLRINQHIRSSVVELFDCYGEKEYTHKFQLTRPAIVRSLGSARWEVEQKGILQLY